MYLYKNYGISYDINNMKDDKKSSIIKEALTDYNAIKESAEANAKQKLAEEFPEKFNDLLKEELQSKNKKTKESYKKLDETKEPIVVGETESNKESDMKKDVKETKKVEETAGKDGVFTIPAKKVAKVEEDVKITDTVGKSDPFKEKAKGVQKVEETAGDGKPFDEKAKKPLQTEEFNITELDVDGVGSALESAENEDEVITMDEIEQEISTMQGLGEELKGIAPESPSYMEKGNKGIAFNQLVNMRNQIDEMIKSMGNNMEEMHAGGATDGAQTYGTDSQINTQHAQGPTDKLIDEKNMKEMHAGGATNGTQTYGTDSQINTQHAQGPTDKLIDEEPITDKDIEAVLGGGVSESEIEESKTQTLANMKKVTATIPGDGYRDTAAANKMRSGLQTESKKVGGLIEENKKLTKQLNETKKYKQSVTTLVEQYKSALEKYRNQLKEMATFNTNLAHVNNLLVNESLALTQDDKIKIINEFKKVDTIAESQKRYKAILTEMKGSRKTLTESIENKVSASIQPSSKQKLDEVVEKTAYENNEHINRMKHLIEYVEKTRSKKIIN
jgi:hypothetical protein